LDLIIYKKIRNLLNRFVHSKTMNSINNNKPQFALKTKVAHSNVAVAAAP